MIKKNVYFTSMKKFLTLLMLMIYLLGTTGVVLSKHFCGSKVSHISLLGKKKPCKCGKVKMPKSCCKDTSVKLSADDNQRLPHFDYSTDSQFVLSGLMPSTHHVLFTPNGYSQRSTKDFYIYKTGPPKTPIYLSLHSLLI